LAPLDYQAYLASPHWQRFKLAFREQRPWRCGCGATRELHHVTYDRLGHERLDDVVPLCPRCHRMAHDLPEPERQEPIPVAGRLFPWERDEARQRLAAHQLAQTRAETPADRTRAEALAERLGLERPVRTAPE
jgi:hypothetical protein